MSYKNDSSEIKVAMNFFETFPECSLPSTVSKKKNKNDRSMMGQSYAICFYACTRANHVR